MKIFIKNIFNKLVNFFGLILKFLKKENTKNKISSLISSLICIICGLILGLIILLIIDASSASNVFQAILKGGFGTSDTIGGWKFGLGNQLTYTAALICVGLSVLFAYKSGMFNIGCAGQYTLGAFGVILFGIALNCPWWVCMLAAIVFGGIWGAIPGIFKAYFKVNEVITCIMFNWIGLYLVNDILRFRVKVDITLGNTVLHSVFNNSKTLSLSSVNKSALIPDLGLRTLFTNNPYSPSSLTIAIFVAIFVVFVISIVLNHTTLGYEIKSCGANKYASQYAGINQKSRIIIAMAISGALAGLGAALFYLTDIEQYSSDVTKLSGLAFNGIPIAFMANLNPVGVIFASFFVAHIEQGASNLQGSMYSTEMSSIFTGIIIYFCAFAPLVLTFVKKWFNKKKKKVNNGGDK